MDFPHDANFLRGFGLVSFVEGFCTKVQVETTSLLSVSHLRHVEDE